MIVGVPREIKEHEYRVGLMPVGVEALCTSGHRVVLEKGAGLGSGFSDDDYVRRGASLVNDASGVYSSADLVVKVKEPQPEEVRQLRAGQLLFTYLHLAADERLTRGLIDSRATALAYETLEDDVGRLPLLVPMSEVAGRMSVQQGAKYLERAQGGRGLLLGGVPGVERGHVTVLGGGVVGASAARVAAGYGADVFVLDTDVDRLRQLASTMPANVTLLYSNRDTIADQLARADLVIGAVLLRGARAPRLVSRADLSRMQPGAVVVDVAVDQGGCFETTRATTHARPTYVVDGIQHYAVANMPGVVGRTSTPALCNATLPYVLRLARLGLERAMREDAALLSAVNIHRGSVAQRAVADTFGLRHEPFAG